MIYLALGMIGFGVGDLLRWSPEAVSRSRAACAAGGATAVVASAAALCGMSVAQVAGAAAIAFLILFSWIAYEPAFEDDGDDSRRSLDARYALLVFLLVLVALLASSGSAPAAAGELESWLAGLPFPALGTVSADQLLLVVGATLFLLATANRIVRMLLSETDASPGAGEGTLRGGRLLGPMERLVIAAAVISGQLAAAAFVIAAKGLLRFPEIRAQSEARIDEVTEYFLIGTFASVIVAAAVSLVVLASF